MTQLGLQRPGYRLTDPRQFAILLARVTDLFGNGGSANPLVGIHVAFVSLGGSIDDAFCQRRAH
jgi:hypothetical protein